mgnify:CR=1 FL=1
MAKDYKKLVQALTRKEETFAQWYTHICLLVRHPAALHGRGF